MAKSQAALRFSHLEFERLKKKSNFNHIRFSKLKGSKKRAKRISFSKNLLADHLTDSMSKREYGLEKTLRQFMAHGPGDALGRA